MRILTILLSAVATATISPIIFQKILGQIGGDIASANPPLAIAHAGCFIIFCLFLFLIYDFLKIKICAEFNS